VSPVIHILHTLGQLGCWNITKRNSHLEINIRENGMDNPETALGIQDTGRPQTEQKTLHRKLKR
jgi:hypothetical protein